MPNVSATAIEADELAPPIMTGTLGALSHFSSDTASSCPVTSDSAALRVLSSARQLSAARKPSVRLDSRAGSQLISSTVKIIVCSQQYESSSTLRQRNVWWSIKGRKKRTLFSRVIVLLELKPLGKGQLNQISDHSLYTSRIKYTSKHFLPEVPYHVIFRMTVWLKAKQEVP
ncbi:hypothetical protein AOLI_G00100970 [Acnodon oligacanthus]